MKQLFKILSILLFIVVLITSFFALQDKISYAIPLTTLLVTGFSFYFYLFIDIIEQSNYESQDNWYEQLEDEESEYNYFPDRD